MVCATARCMNETSSNTRYKELVVNEKLYNWVELFTAFLKHAIQFLCLRHGARETVKNKTEMARMASQFYACFPFSPVPSPLHRFSTHPFLQDLLFSNCSLIMPTMMSSETRPPASMISFAFTPRAVFFCTCSRSISPVAKWHTQNLSRMLGAWVPLPK